MITSHHLFNRYNRDGGLPWLEEEEDVEDVACQIGGGGGEESIENFCESCDIALTNGRYTELNINSGCPSSKAQNSFCGLKHMLPEGRDDFVNILKEVDRRFSCRTKLR